MNKRQWPLFATLGLTLLATGWAALQDEADPAEGLLAKPPKVQGSASKHTPDGAAEPARAARRAVPAEVATSGPLTLAEFTARTPFAAEGADFAAPLSFRPPPPPPRPAPPPMAPALPFRYIGAMDDGEGRSAMLMDGNRLHIVRKGDTLDNRYRVEQVGEASIDFTYLPLKQRQSLSVSRS